MTIDLVDEDTAAPPVPPSSTPTRAVPASAAEELDGEYASYDAPAPASRVEHLDPDEASFASALAAATTARARAEEARRFATQKTAKATALTMQAKELLDVAAGARGEPRPRPPPPPPPPPRRRGPPAWPPRTCPSAGAGPRRSTHAVDRT